MSILRGAVIGYGGAFNMGKQHAEQMIKNGIHFVSACDLSDSRMEEAKRDFPELEVIAIA